MQENIKYLFQKYLGEDDFHYLTLDYDGYLNEGSHYHDFYELFLVREGHIDYLIDGSKYTLGAYDLVLTNPRELHKPIYKDKKYGISFITFRRLFLPYGGKEGGFDPLRALDNRKNGSYNKIAAAAVKEYGIDTLFREIEEKLRTDDSDTVFYVQAKLMLLLCAINKACEKSTDSCCAHKEVEKIIAYINGNLNKDLRSHTLEKIFFLESHYIRRSFKKHTGYTLGNYINLKRTIEAAELLRKGIPAGEASRMVGFEDYSTFYRVFKKLTGKAPSEIH